MATSVTPAAPVAASTGTGTTPTGVDQLERELAVLTRRIEAAARRSDLHREMDRAGYLIARTVDEQGTASVGVLAERLGLDGSTVTRQLDALESRGFIEREIDAAD